MNAPLSHVRTLTLAIADEGGAQHEFELLETEGMSLLCALKQVGEALPPHLGEAFVCHAGACNTCSVLINGQPGVPCTMFVRELGKRISIHTTPQLHFVFDHSLERGADLSKLIQEAVAISDKTDPDTDR